MFWILLMINELFHVTAHLGVLLRLTPFTEKDIKSHQGYFIWDLLSVFSSLLYINSLPPSWGFFFLYSIMLSSYDSYELNWIFIVTYLYWFKVSFYIYLPVIHLALHMFYLMTWNDGYYSRRIQEWSGCDYHGETFTYDWLLTLGDILCHLYCAYLVFMAS